MLSKPELRRQLLTQRAAEPLWKRQQISQGIFEHLQRTEAFSMCKVIMLYCSAENEIITDHMIEYCLNHGKTVCVPRCEGKGVMSAYCIQSLSDLELGRYGIREPVTGSTYIHPHEIDVVLAPCLGADHRGYRLGYGGGYYDRFLKSTNATIFALCASQRFVASLPTDSFDQRCHAIVTEKEVYTADEK